MSVLHKHQKQMPQCCIQGEKEDEHPDRYLHYSLRQTLHSNGKWAFGLQPTCIVSVFQTLWKPSVVPKASAHQALSLSMWFWQSDMRNTDTETSLEGKHGASQIIIQYCRSSICEVTDYTAHYLGSIIIAALAHSKRINYQRTPHCLYNVDALQLNGKQCHEWKLLWKQHDCGSGSGGTMKINA